MITVLEAEDDIDQVMEWTQVQAVLLKHHNLLEGVFMHYCGATFTGVSSDSELINMKEWELFLKEAKLVGGKSPAQSAVAAAALCQRSRGTDCTNTPCFYGASRLACDWPIFF